MDETVGRQVSTALETGLTLMASLEARYRAGLLTDGDYREQVAMAAVDIRAAIYGPVAADLERLAGVSPDER